MPLYEYQCAVCGTRFEKMVRFSEIDQSHECPKCGSRETRKAISVFSTSGISTSNSAAQNSSCNSRGAFR